MSNAKAKDAGGIRIISILSGKGGVGKTILAFNLAERLATLGARPLLVDADLNCGNLHILANSEGAYGFREVIRGELSVREAVTSTPYGFDILAAGQGEAMGTDSEVTAIAVAIGRLRHESENYDVVVIDHSSGVSRAATVMAHASDQVILLVVPELTSISDGYGLYKHLIRTDSGLDCHLVVNRAESGDEAAYIHSKLCAVSERFLGNTPRYLGHILEDRCFRESVASQKTLTGLKTETTAIQQLTALARRLLKPQGGSVKASPAGHSNNQKIINKSTALADIRE
jgi:flagellar biosynthesis protein FlhG